ncbi:Lar family restriction alleviation protein [Rhodoferax sp.]|uniref:Lar family restriction alleviation protein n=1 Tax=Rhodoferax sp. TaxID=50421 RepID=UPI003453FA86
MGLLTIVGKLFGAHRLNPSPPQPSQVEPCPFCRSRLARAIEVDTGLWATYCGDCKALGPRSSSEQEAARLWNSWARKPEVLPQ